jgi:hypothetical protein
LADQDSCEWGRRVHPRIRQKTELFELGWCQQMSLVNYEHDPPVPFGFFGGEQVSGLGHDLDFVEAGGRPPRLVRW